MNFREAAERAESYIIERRRFYHACPELSCKELHTRDSIVEDLKAMGLEPVLYDGPAGHGCIADIVGSAEGKTIALRADIDALPVKEETGLEFASTNGAMHACGHDNHIAMLLGAAKMLVENKESLKGTVRLLFQPSEETATGAKAYVEAGFLDGVDAIYGAHIWAGLDVPYVSIESGNRMASTGKFRVEIEGKSSHGSEPSLGVDAVVTAAAAIMNLQTYVSRNNHPLNPLVVTVGIIEAGSRWNVLAGKAVFEGTTRTFSKNLLTEAPEALQRIVENTAAAYGAKATFTHEWLTIPVINDDEHLVKIGQDAVKKLYGEESLGHLNTLMGGEDFSFFMEKVPGVYGYIGSHVPGEPLYANHHEKYDVDEAMLKKGAAVYAQFAHDFLAE